MRIPRGMWRWHSRRLRARAVVPMFFVGVVRCRAAVAQTVDRSKTLDGFGESRRGDIPEGTAELMTSDTDKAIKNGLAWLARTQNSDGSYRRRDVSRQHRGDEPGGLAFMASGSSPGRGPYGSQIDKALVYVMDNTSQSGFIAVAASVRRMVRCIRMGSARCSWRKRMG